MQISRLVEMQMEMFQMLEVLSSSIPAQISYMHTTITHVYRVLHKLPQNPLIDSLYWIDNFLTESDVYLLNVNPTLSLYYSLKLIMVS